MVPENLGIAATITFITLGAIGITILVIRLQAKGRALTQSKVRVEELEDMNDGIPKLKSDLRVAEIDRDSARRERDDWKAHWDGIVKGAPSGGPELGR